MMNTALHSHFDTFYSNRYLTTLNIKELHDWLAGIPYEHIIILTNTNEYGGGGILNSYVLSMTHHKQFKPVVVQSFGLFRFITTTMLKLHLPAMVLA